MFVQMSRVNMLRDADASPVSTVPFTRAA